jgi:phosphoribosylformylglycinamidine synthase
LIWQIEVSRRSGTVDPAGQAARSDLAELHLGRVEDVRLAVLYLIEGELDESGARRVAAELLTDEVTQQFRINTHDTAASGNGKTRILEVQLKPGVMDPVAASTEMAIRDMGLPAVRVRTAKRYYVTGELDAEQLSRAARAVLANDSIEQIRLGASEPAPAPQAAPYQLQVRRVDLLKLDDDGLERLSADGELFLNLREMKALQDHYRQLGREPTDVELETLAQTWSEHCVHKTLKGLIDYNGVRIDNLLASTIARVTRELDRDWCISVFEDNAGVIRFDEQWAVCFKVETHNHPSAIEPYGGAATGIGGVIRDPLGTGMGAKPIANTDIFCFAPPDTPFETLPKGVLHPRRVMKGVVAGVRDYGNRMGIPTVNGAVFFDPRYLGNCLVYCGNIGLLPADKASKHQKAGDMIVVVGGRTGRDGIHGATFSSGELTSKHETEFSHAVQIGNPITEKKVVDTLMVARDRGLYSAITDCGAGGLSSSIGEMGAELGAEVDIERVPLKYEGLRYDEIWISEAQERMTLAVPPEHLDELMEIFRSEDVEATVLGRFTDSGKLVIRYEGTVVGELDMQFLHHGVPQYVRKAVWSPPAHPAPFVPEKDDYGEGLKHILGAWNVCSKEWIIRQYDHEVQGGSVVKPLTGVANDGPSDAAVCRPLLDRNRGIVISNGINPKYGDLDPYWMAASGIDEAIRNAVAVGADPDRIAILDNFCWGNPSKPEVLGGLVRAALACYDAGVAFGTPFISGKDSLNNEFATEDGQTIIIPATLLISAIGLIEDVTRCVTMDAKDAGNAVFLVGETKDELGGSHYYGLVDRVGGAVPTVDFDVAPRTMRLVADAIARGWVRACHDLSEGGLAAAAAEMAFAGGVGMRIDLAGVSVADDVRRDDAVLFSESNSRFLLEVAPQFADEVVRHFSGKVRFGRIGETTEAQRLVVIGRRKRAVIDEPLNELKEAWQSPLRW